MANPTASGYGYWDASSQQWRSWVRITQTADTDTSATYKVEAWLCARNGSSSNASNIGGWAGIWDTTNGYRWSAKVNVGNFSAGDEWCFKTQSWSVPKLHSSQTVYGYSDIVASAGIYTGRTSNNTGEYEVKLSLGAKTHYSVSYSANGGSGAPAAQTKWYGETLTLQTDTPTRTGYTFSGWNTKSDGTGTNYSAGGSYSSNSAATLYAKWTANTYDVTFNGNGSTGGSTAAQSKVYGVNLTLRSNGFTRTGYTFKGWATSASGSVAYTNGATYTGNAALNLYAVWQINTYSVSYNANGGSGAPAAQTKTYNVTLKLSSSAPTRTGYAFKGWATTQARANSGTVDYSAGGSYAANEAATLYATWQVAAPSLAITSVYRCTSAGVADDDGTYAAIEASWSSTVSGYSGITWQAKVGTITSFTVVAHQESGNSGTVTIVVGSSSNPLSTDDTYDVELKATDSNGTSTRTGQLSVAWYPIDIKVGGHAIAFGKVAATDNLADFGMDVNVDGTVTTSTPIGAASGGTGQDTLQKSANALVNALSVGTSAPQDADYYVAQYAGGGTATTTYHRRPLSALWTWIKGKADTFYLSLAGGTITGTVKMSSANPSVRFDTTSVTNKAGTDVPSSTTAMASDLAYDKNGDLSFYSQLMRTSDDSLYRSFVVRRTLANGNAASHGFYMHVGADGTADFGLTGTGSSRHWHKAISPWTSIATTSGTTAKTFSDVNTAGYTELLIVCKYSTTYRSSVVVPVAELDTTDRWWYLGGGWWSTGYGAACKLTRTKITPDAIRVGGSSVNADWVVYAR